MALVARDCREADQMLARLADAVHAEHAEFEAKLRQERSFRFPGVLTQQVIRWPQLEHALSDI